MCIYIHICGQQPKELPWWHLPAQPTLYRKAWLTAVAVTEIWTQTVCECNTSHCLRSVCPCRLIVLKTVTHQWGITKTLLKQGRNQLQKNKSTMKIHDRDKRCWSPLEKWSKLNLTMQETTLPALLPPSTLPVGCHDSCSPAGATAVWGGAGRDPQLGWAHATCWGAFSPACALADCREQHVLGNKTVTDKSKAPTSPPEDVQFWEHPHSQKSKGLGMLIFL